MKVGRYFFSRKVLYTSPHQEISIPIPSIQSTYLEHHGATFVSDVLSVSNNSENLVVIKKINLQNWFCDVSSKSDLLELF